MCIRERIQGVHDQDEDPVDPAAEIARNEAKRDADHDGEDDGENDDFERRTGAEDDSRKDILAADRGAHPVGPGRWLLGTEDGVAYPVDVEAVRCDPRCEYRYNEKDCDDDEARIKHDPLKA